MVAFYLLARALAGVLAICVASGGAQAPGRPGAGVTNDPGSSTRTLQTGVEVLSLWRDWEVNSQMLDRVAASGSDWVRVGVGWCSLEERGPGIISAWYQDRLDSTVGEAARRGLKVLVTLGCTPLWAGGDAGYKVMPRDASQFARVAQYLATRFRGRVQAWEIWNEPDCSTGTCPEADPAAYLPVLRAGYAAVKAADRAATVVTGGVSGANADWIRRLYAAGAKGTFDALALHPYQGPAAEPPEAPPTDHPYRISNVEKVRQVMLDNRDGARPIWFTEFGWTTGAGVGWSAGVDEAVQADYLGRAVKLIQNEYPYVTHAFWFTVRDRDDWTPYENQFGLLHLDGSPKPALAALRTANAWLDSLRTRRTTALNAVADTVVHEQAPTTTGGSRRSLVSDDRESRSEPRTRATSYLRFVVPALGPDEAVVAASLHLLITGPTRNGPAVWRTGAAWNEATITWRSGRPARLGVGAVGNVPRMSTGPVELPLSAHVTAGPVAFELVPESRDGTAVASRESSGAVDRPRLVLQVALARTR